MAEIICHHNGRYNIYCTIPDGFYWVESISLEQLQGFTKEQHGQRGLDILPDRLERAHKNGHSSLSDGSGLDGFLCCNRAGENEAHLSTEQCIKQFLS